MKANEAESSKNNGKIVWQCIRNLQQGRNGMLPLRTSNIEDENGNVCESVKLVLERWRRHFPNILNIDSVFKVDEISRLQQKPVREELSNPPSKQEILEAVGKLRMERLVESLVSYQK